MNQLGSHSSFSTAGNHESAKETCSDAKQKMASRRESKSRVCFLNLKSIRATTSSLEKLLFPDDRGLWLLQEVERRKVGFDGNAEEEVDSSDGDDFVENTHCTDNMCCASSDESTASATLGRNCGARAPPWHKHFSGVPICDDSDKKEISRRH